MVASVGFKQNLIRVVTVTCKSVVAGFVVWWRKPFYTQHHDANESARRKYSYKHRPWNNAKPIDNEIEWGG
jgi:hypothetical protein